MEGGDDANGSLGPSQAGQAIAGGQDEPKPKASRSVKTPLQKEALEAAYNINPLPNEEVRKALGDRIGLTAHQVQIWFSHRRRKDKTAAQVAQACAAQVAATQNYANPDDQQGQTAPSAQQTTMPPPSVGRSRASTPPLHAPTSDAELMSHQHQAGGSSRFGDSVSRQPSATPVLSSGGSGQPPTAPSSPSQVNTIFASYEELEELLMAARQRLPQPYREDGPPLGYYFDSIPLVSAEGRTAAEVGEKRKRVVVDDYEMEGDEGGDLSVMRMIGDGGYGMRSMDKYERERTRHEERQWREREKELDKMTREQRRAFEREERERRKADEMKAKEDARLRAMQEREAKRMREAAEKERRAQERKENVERKRREKEMLKALAQQEKQATRMRHREAAGGPRDDLDIEMEALVTAQQQQHPGDGEGEVQRSPMPPPERPPFPPTSLPLEPAFPPELGEQLGGDLLMLWAFLHSFSELLGLWPSTVDELLAALAAGESSRLLGEVHVGLLRLLQADMEEAHASGAGQGGVGSAADRSIAQMAGYLEEAWAWGFDVDVWRAHLNPLTWPEVLREFAIAAGLGRKRRKGKREARPKMGTEGEDVVADESGGLKLRLPVRFSAGTVKAAAWQVLAEAGPAGLNIIDIAKRIQQSGLRDLRTSRTPEASVAAALSRDVVFGRTAPATYALNSLLKNDKLSGVPGCSGSAEPEKKDGVLEVKAEPGSDGEAAVKQEADVKHEGEGHGHTHGHETDLDSDAEGHEEAEEDDEVSRGEPWVAALEGGEYSGLTLEMRMAALVALVHLALDGHSVRACLDSRLEEAQRVRKAMWDDAKAEKRKRQMEAAERARRAAAEAQAALEKFRQQNNLGEGTPAPGSTEGQGRSDADGDTEMVDAGRTSGPAAAEGQPNGAHANHEEDEVDAAQAAKERQQLRAETIRKAEEANALRAEPLGQDRRYNRYWRFAADSEPGSGRIFVELQNTKSYKVLGDLEQLMEALERRGAREGALYSALLRHKEAILSGMPAKPLQLPSDAELEQACADADQQAWLYNLPTQAHVRASDPATAGALSADDATAFNEQQQPRIGKLKADLLRVQATLPPAALMDSWQVDTWQSRVKDATTAEELRSALGEFETHVHEEYISPNFKRKSAHVNGSQPPVGKSGSAVAATAVKEDPQGSDIAHSAENPGGQAEAAEEKPGAEAGATAATDAEDWLAWLPPTVAAVSLRLAAFDAALIYSRGVPPARDTLQAYKYIQRPALPVEHAEGGLSQGQAASSRVVSGQPIGLGGRTRPSLFPPFPQALLQGPLQPFKLPVEQLRAAIAAADNDATQEPSAAQTSDPASAALASRGTPPAHRSAMGRAQKPKRLPQKSMLRRELDAMKTDDEDDEDEDEDEDDSGDDMATDHVYPHSSRVTPAFSEPGDDDEEESDRPEENEEISD